MSTWQQVEATAKRVGFFSYEDYLKSEHWQSLKRDMHLPECFCCVCGTQSGLLAHHKQYRNLTDVAVADLAPMCNKCHEDFHLACRYFKKDYVGLGELEIALTTDAFRKTEYFLKRAKKLERRAKIRAERAKNGNSKKVVRHRFNDFMRGKLTHARAVDFTLWLVDYVKNQ